MLANRSLTAALLIVGSLAGSLTGFFGAARAETCGPDALGVSRTIPIGGAPRLGLKTYPQTLDLNEHEVVLTFDDGPGATTPRVLAALEKECVRATFFLIGRNAAGMPALVRREIADGDTVGHHSWSHPARTLRSLPLAAAVADIDRGVAAAQMAADGKASKFFRFPGFGDSPELLEALSKRDMPTFGADLWASDWNEMSPEEELELLMGRLRRAGRGIILLHDTRRQTADMLPSLLAALKAQHFHIVHMIPGDLAPPSRPAPAGWTSETEATLRDMGLQVRPAAAKEVRPAAAKEAPPSPDRSPDGVPTQAQGDAPGAVLPEPAAKP